MENGGLVYSRFAIYHVDEADVADSPTFPFPFVDGSQFRAVNVGIDEPATQVNFEDFLPGPEIPWTLFHDEIQYVVSGRAEIEYWLPPLMAQTGKVEAGPGSIYLLPRGCRVIWRVLGDEPFRHLCICVPNPGYPIAVARSAAAAAGQTIAP